MATKKNEEQEKDLNIALGNGVEITGFIDGKTRTAYPVTLANFNDFAKALSNTATNLYYNFIIDEAEGLKQVLADTFKTEDLEDIMENINANNFEEILLQIYEINGLGFANEEKAESNDSKKK